MKTGKPSTQLPLRGALNDLQLSQRTITDYAKLSPIKPQTKQMNVIDLARQDKNA